MWISAEKWEMFGKDLATIWVNDWLSSHQIFYQAFCKLSADPAGKAEENKGCVRKIPGGLNYES